MEIVKAALAQYGASLSRENRIVDKHGKVTSVQVVIKGKRIRFESPSSLLGSGPLSAAGVEHFVELFWFWKKP